LTGPELFEVVEWALPPHRERQYPPTETLSMFLAQALNAYRSCQKVVNDRSVSGAVLNPLKRGDLLLGDAFYATYFLLCSLRERGIDAVFEQQGSRQRTTDFDRGQRLGPRDYLIVLPKPAIKPGWMLQTDYEQAPVSLTVRELHAGGKTLVTTLLCPKQTDKAALKVLYRDRWHVELDLRNLKTTLGIERLSGLTPEMALKEIWGGSAGLPSDSIDDGAGRRTHPSTTAPA
jgi:Transposase DDE domain